MRYVLIGSEGKRQAYFARALQAYQQELKFIDWQEQDLIAKLTAEDKIKIDPIENKSMYIDDLNNTMFDYQKILGDLQSYQDSVEKGKSNLFINAPKSIAMTLDKKLCKGLLRQAQLDITPELAFKGSTLEELLEFLHQEGISQVFIKPNLGSGAAGIVALRYHRRKNQLHAQTAMYSLRQGKDGQLPIFVNTKRLRKIRTYEEIRAIVDYVLSMDSIVELWLAKASVNQLCYDLRVVFQFGKIAFIQARGTKNGAITNLHLNNMPLALSEIALSDEKLADIQALCAAAVDCFDQLRIVGFDILLEKHSLKPYIIEMNAQGDLMYQDIYNHNIIYQQQAEMMVKGWENK